MDNDTTTSAASDPIMPRTAPFSTGSERAGSTTSGTQARAVAVSEHNDRTGIFGNLVKDDADIAGLVAYSIYKQNKLDWLRAFETAKGRPPTEAEADAYIVGEGTGRRLATYRHLAEATLAGNGPGSDPSARGGLRRFGAVDARTLTNGLMLTYGLIAVMFVIILWFASHLVR